MYFRGLSVDPKLRGLEHIEELIYTRVEYLFWCEGEKETKKKSEQLRKSRYFGVLEECHVLSFSKILTFSHFEATNFPIFFLSM